MEKIKILHLEDDPTDSELVLSELAKAGLNIEYLRVDDEKNFIYQLNNSEHDIILADYNLPSYDGIKALKICHQLRPDIPFIIVSGTLGEEIAVTMLKFGASDYLLKQNLTRLVPAINQALEQKELKRLKLQAEAGLKQSEEKYRKIFDNVQDVFYQIDTQGLISEISPSIFRMAGYRREELIGIPSSVFYHDIGERAILLDEISKKGEVWDYEVRFRTKTGHIKYTSINAHLHFDSMGKHIGIEGSLRDIDERKHFEIQLKESKEKAEVSDHLKTAFLHNISHEIRTPMNAIIGFSSLLGDCVTNPEMQSSFVAIIQDSSNQLLSIINDIVDISSIEANAISKNITTCNLNSTLKSLFTQFNIKTSEKNISLTFKTGLSDDQATIRTDNTRLIQILSNLLNNSLKFTSKGHIEFGYILNESMLEFFVSDTGIGIEPEFHSKIFNSFFQVETALSRQFGGTGLGLSICKAYVELLGGKIWVISEPGHGSVFYFTIPYDPVVQSVSDEIKPDLPILWNNKEKLYILVAEDDENNIKLIENLLRELNVEIYKACNGVEAVKKCKSGVRIDLVLMDLKMPLMDGYTATGKIKNLFPDIPVIAQTAYFNEREKALACGCNDFISKPFNKVQLLSKIAEYIH